MKASPQRDATVMRLRDQGKTAREVAKIIGMSEGAITSIYSRGLVKREEERRDAISRLLQRWRRVA